MSPPSQDELPREPSAPAADAPPDELATVAKTDAIDGELVLPAAGKHDKLNSAAIEASKEAKRREAEEDRELIKLAQSGDKAAFRRLVDRHQRRAFSIAFGLVRDDNDAREIVQEAFLRVFRGLDTFQNNSSFFTWLYRIVTNLAIDLMRKPGRKGAELDESRAIDDDAAQDFPLMSRIDGADPIDVIRRREIAKRIQAALDDLPPYHRGVILMREVEGMSYEEMAQAMGVSKGTIMSRLFHARQKMQKALADCYAEQGRLGKPSAVNGEDATDAPDAGDGESEEAS